MALSGTNFTLGAVATLSKSLNLPGSGASSTLLYNQTYPFEDGTADSQADMIWYDERTIAPSANDDLDLNGVLLDSLGQNFNIVRVRGILVTALATNVGEIRVGNAASAAFFTWTNLATSYVVVHPGGAFMLLAPQDGYVVTATTADKLRVANPDGANSVTYDIVVLGCSA